MTTSKGRYHVGRPSTFRRRPDRPRPATTFAHLDATTVLSRGIPELGIYPAVDPPDSDESVFSARDRRRGALLGGPREVQREFWLT